MHSTPSALRLVTPLVAGLSLAFGLACGGGGSGGGTGYTAPEDPCALLTPAEVTSVLDKEVEGILGENDEFVAQCLWEPQGIVAEVVLIVYANPNQADNWTDQFLDSLRDVAETDMPEEIDDLGDEAFIVGEENSWSVQWRTGNDYVVVLSIAPTEGSASAMQVTDLAASVESRMP